MKFPVRLSALLACSLLACDKADKPQPAVPPASVSASPAEDAASSATAHGPDADEAEPCPSLEKETKSVDSLEKAVLALYAKDTAFLAGLKRAKSAAEAYETALLELRYPGEDKQAEYGSAYSGLCVCAHRLDHLGFWKESLTPYLQGAQEGDVCSGSQLRLAPDGKPYPEGDQAPED